MIAERSVTELPSILTLRIGAQAEPWSQRYAVSSSYMMGTGTFALLFS